MGNLASPATTSSNSDSAVAEDRASSLGGDAEAGYESHDSGIGGSSGAGQLASSVSSTASPCSDSAVSSMHPSIRRLKEEFGGTHIKTVSKFKKD